MKPLRTPWADPIHRHARHGGRSLHTACDHHPDHRADHHAMRHRGHAHAGRGGHRGFAGDASTGWDGLGQGRKLSSLDLQLLILALLAERPRHGYELIKELEERSAGYYVPSPGMIYPALSYLEEIGHATVESAGSKKLYTVTVAGLSHLDEHRAAVEAMLAQLTRIGHRMAQLRRAMGEGPDERANMERGGRIAQALYAVLHRLEHAVRERAAASPDEQARVLAVLQRALDDIGVRSERT